MGWFPQYQFAGWQLLVSLAVSRQSHSPGSYFLTHPWYSFIQDPVGNMCTLADVKYCTQHSGVARRLLQGWLQGPAFAAVEENRLYRCIEEAEFDLTGEVGVP